MQTHCPNCETHFRVTESQIDVADGYVRCGVCEEVFNVYEVADKLSLEDEQQLQLDNIDHLSDTVAEQRPETQDSEPEEKNDFHDEALSDEVPVTAEQTNDDDEAQESHDDFFDEETNESLHYIVPEDLRDSASSKSSGVAATVLWSIGTLLLIACLGIEYIWFNRHQFHQFPELQTGLDMICQQLECDNQSQRDPEEIELVTRNIYSHPKEKDALMVDIVMRNNADYAQPYPVLQIDFSDIRGGNIAARRFFPSEYLASSGQHSETSQPHEMQPHTDVSVTLEIKDPGKEAMTYEFNFL